MRSCRVLGAFAFGAAAGIVAYFEVLLANFWSDGTINSTWPDDSCARSVVIDEGVATYRDCPATATTRWPQRAINWPARALHQHTRWSWSEPQEVRLPPHGDDRMRERWRAWLWITLGMTGYAAVGGAITTAANVVHSAATRRRRRRRRATSNSQSLEPARSTRKPINARRIGALVLAVFATATVALPVVWLLARRPADRYDASVYAPPNVRALTRGPLQHFFGYYDKLQFDPTDRYVLGLATRRIHRYVAPRDRAEIGMIDLEADDPNWIPLGQTHAWNWQQGCMLQWIPRTDDQIIWNDREGDGSDARFVARILDVSTREIRTIDSPIFTLTPDGTSALTIDFVRLQRARPTYGYVGVHDPSEGVFAPDDNGVFRVDLASGERRLLLSLEEIVAFGRSAGDPLNAEHYVEMIQLNPSGSRFVVFERWDAGLADTADVTGTADVTDTAETSLRTRVLTADLDGSDLFVLAAGDGTLSHVAWLDDTRLTVYTSDHAGPDGYGLFEDRRGLVETLLATSRDGHQSFFADGEWMLSDTYRDDDGVQHPFLYHLPSETLFSVAHLLAPPEYQGKLRCDNHPRVSRDGRKVVIDSAHRRGRQMYLIDIGEILDSR